MARKTVADIKPRTKEAIEEFKLVSEMKFELAKEAYDKQDEETQSVIDRIVATLRQYATGYVTVQAEPPHGGQITFKVDSRYIGFNLFWLGMEIVKDLAILGVRVESYVFPPSQCTNCGAEIIPELRKSKRKVR